MASAHVRDMEGERRFALLRLHDREVQHVAQPLERVAACPQVSSADPFGSRQGRIRSQAH